ncbi:MAG: lipopolysaccharide biosynthesis protein [Cyanobacteria bacterium P01_F01_bin.86]
MISQLTQSLVNLGQDRFIRNLSWMGLSEVGIRISRLGATVILARFLTAEDYGLAAIVLTTHQFIRVFTRNGILNKIIQADEADVEDICKTAYWLNWMLSFGLFLVQVGVAFMMSSAYRNQTLILPICLIAATYLIYPLGLVQAALVQRQNQMRIWSLANLLQVGIDNLLTGLLAFLGMGMWAIVLPKLLTAPILVVMMWRHSTWRPVYGFTLKKWQHIIHFGSRVLGVEWLTTLRENIDYLLIGRFLSVEALGVYYFAFNAGLGISLSVINAIKVSLYPDLCKAKSEWGRLRSRYRNGLRTIAKIIVPLVILQASLAPFYVPIVFGNKWVEQGAIPILVLICLSAIPRPFADAASLLLRAIDKPNLELRWHLVFTAVLAVAIVVGAQAGIVGVAIAVLLIHGGLLPVYTWLTSRYVNHRAQRQPAS